MARVEAVLRQKEILCTEPTAGPVSFVVFGASGDLAHRKLFPSLFELFRRNMMSRRFYLLGCGRTKFTHEQFRSGVELSLSNEKRRFEPDLFNDFIRRFFYLSGDYSDPSLYQQICQQILTLDEQYNVTGSRIFYLSVPPVLYETVSEKLGELKLNCPTASGRFQEVRLVIEKPFGRDLRSAVELDLKLHRYFNESQIYRIDHYLGKETVQNLLVFRFANSIFEPIWNRNHIESICITAAEQVGVEHRAGYYDQSGALRDMFQNHLLQMMTMVAMEPPTSFEADSVRDEKIKLLRSIRRVQQSQVAGSFIRGQYGPGTIKGRPVKGYLLEEGVPADSKTETYVAAALFVDNWRWKGVPFHLSTGKRLPRKITEIMITFKQVPHLMFPREEAEQMDANTLRFQIQPQEGIYLGLQAKRPGSKICMSNLEMAVDYQQVFGIEMPEAYQRLLLDCMLGDSTLFTRHDSVIASWELIMPVLEAWKASGDAPKIYPAGSPCPQFSLQNLQ